MSIKDIETILDTLRFDGKLEMTLVNDTSAGSSRPGEYNQKKLYKAVKPILTSTGLVRVPCGVCPVRFLLFFRMYPDSGNLIPRIFLDLDFRRTFHRKFEVS